MAKPEVDGMSVSRIRQLRLSCSPRKPTVAEDGAIVGTRG